MQSEVLGLADRLLLSARRDDRAAWLARRRSWHLRQHFRSVSRFAIGRFLPFCEEFELNRFSLSLSLSLSRRVV
jgi:hypothetical protein